MVKSDRWIAAMSREHSMIEPFEENQISGGVISYGLSSYGYDMRLGSHFMVARIQGQEVIDPKSADTLSWETVTGSEMIIQPGHHILGSSLEYFRIPRDVMGLVCGKSTYARSGLLINVTPLEPEWEGFLTIALFNTSHCPLKIYSGEGIAQVIFLGADGVCAVSYADRKGKYQGQTQITKSIVPQSDND